MTHRQQTIANAFREALAIRSMQLEAQSASARILAHGAADRAEMDELARLCDVPTIILRAELSVAS